MYRQVCNDCTMCKFHVSYFLEEEGAEQQNANQKIFSDEEISNIVDMVLKEDDLNSDGLVNLL